MGWVSSEPCSHSVTLKDSDLLGTDCTTQVFTGWPPVGLSGCVAQIFSCGFYLGHRAAAPWVLPGQRVKKSCQPSSSQGHMDTFCFHWYNYLATVFLPSIGLEVIITHIEALTKFSQQVLNGSWQNLSFLDTESNEKSNHLKQDGLDFITALQGNLPVTLPRVLCVCTWWVY